MKYQLVVESVYAAMYTAAEGDCGRGLEALNVNDDEWELLTGEKPWVGMDLEPVRACLDKVIWGTMHAAGYDRFEVFAEYIAGVIALVVHPVNIKKSCHFFAGKLASLQQVVRPGEVGAQEEERVSKERLFALIFAALTDSSRVNLYKATFEKTALRKVFKSAISSPLDAENKGVAVA